MVGKAQAIHVRAGSITISGGTFTSGLTGATPYDYLAYNGGSEDLNGDVVIEYSDGYSAITSVSITGGTFTGLGICYYVDPDLSDYSAPSITVSDSYSSSYAAYTSFTAKTTVTVGSKTAYAYFTDSDSASSWSYTDTEGTVFTIGDTETGTYTALPAE